ncbi:MAG: HTH domain-containing protein [Candidatus Methylumidiphilus sp.]
MKAIIEIVQGGEYAQSALEIARRVDAGLEVANADYHIGFHSVERMFSELNPERLQLLEVLQQSGGLSIQVLAKTLGRNESTIHRDIEALMAHELIAKDDDGKVFVPWDEMDIRLSFRPVQSA